MPQDVIILSLAGGQNDTNTPTELAKDECVLAENVEFFNSSCGERRLGCGPVTITSSHLDDEDIMVYLTQWPDDNDILDQQIFAVSATPGVSATVAVRTSGVWSEVTSITDALNTSVPAIYNIDTEALNEKLFVAYRSAVDRLHVWDGTTLRRAGLGEPNPPTVADTAVAGTYATTRYFRIRVARLSGSTVISQSEPSTTVTFTPNGSFNGAVITQPVVLPGEGETHWIVEASTDGSIFYQIETLVIATTSYTDTTAFATGYSSQGEESPEIGDFDTIPSFKYLAVDGDRLVMGGHFTDETLMSTIAWTPTANDPGGSNDERLPLDIDNTKNLDNTSGGPLTGICSSDLGTWYAFKFQSIYRMMRTGDVTDAYDVVCMSKTRGAIEGSIFPGYTEDGASCIYFLDPLMGPSRVGSFGIQAITGLRTTWGRVNLQASAVVARGCFYPYKQQAHWWIAVDGNDRPNFKIINQVSELRSIDGDSVGRGWSTATGTITEAACVSIITETVSIDGVSSISQRPWIGLAEPNFIQRCDTEDEDAGDPYVATILSRPYVLTGQLNQFGAMVASILADANEDYELDIAFIRDFGKETNEVTNISLAPEASETEVFKLIDNLRMSEARAIQVRIQDAG